MSKYFIIKTERTMKYLKISMVALVCSLMFESAMVLADTTVPISGTVVVTSLTWKKSATRTKTNWSNQRLKIHSATCSGCSFTAKPYTTSGATFQATTGIAVGATKSLNPSASIPETWYVDITRTDFSLINQTVGYTYDANALVL